MTSDRPILLLTGAAQGIGHATVAHFSAAGWEIITAAPEDVPAHCRRDPNWSHHIAADLTAADGLAAFVADALAKLDGRPLTALVNNAAISPRAVDRDRVGCLAGSLAAWHKVFELNLFVPLKLARAFAGSLAKARDRAAIVNVTAIAGQSIHPFDGSAYSTSKAALRALTREMAVEFGQIGVRVNAVAPGDLEQDEAAQILIPRIPLHRLCRPEDVAAAIHYLCSTDAAYVTGAELLVTGGRHLW